MRAKRPESLLTFVCACGNAESVVASTSQRERFQVRGSKGLSRQGSGRGCATCKTPLEDFMRKKSER